MTAVSWADPRAFSSEQKRAKKKAGQMASKKVEEWACSLACLLACSSVLVLGET